MGRERVWWRLSLAGTMGAAVGAFVSVAPSLIPRAALIQGLLMGVCAAIGYGIGTSVGWLIRRIRKRSEWAADHRTRIVVGLMVAMVLAMAWGAGVRWQSALADISGVPAPHRWWGPISIGSATAVFVVLLAMGRLIRRLTRALATVLGRLAPDVMARGLAAVMVTVIGAVVLGSLPRLAVVALHPVFRSANAATAPGWNRPRVTMCPEGPDRRSRGPTWGIKAGRSSQESRRPPIWRTSPAGKRESPFAHLSVSIPPALRKRGRNSRWLSWSGSGRSAERSSRWGPVPERGLSIAARSCRWSNSTTGMWPRSPRSTRSCRVSCPSPSIARTPWPNRRP